MQEGKGFPKSRETRFSECGNPPREAPGPHSEGRVATSKYVPRYVYLIIEASHRGESTPREARYAIEPDDAITRGLPQLDARHFFVFGDFRIQEEAMAAAKTPQKTLMLKVTAKAATARTSSQYISSAQKPLPQ